MRESVMQRLCITCHQTFMPVLTSDQRTLFSGHHYLVTFASSFFLFFKSLQMSVAVTFTLVPNSGFSSLSITAEVCSYTLILNIINSSPVPWNQSNLIKFFIPKKQVDVSTKMMHSFGLKSSNPSTWNNRIKKKIRNLTEFTGHLFECNLINKTESIMYVCSIIVLKSLSSEFHF